MRIDGKLDYLEMQAGAGTMDQVRSFYAAAFGWRFIDYGPTYCAFEEGLDGGFDGSQPADRPPLPVLWADDIERTLAAVEAAGATITVPIFDFPGGKRFHFRDPAGNELAVWSE